jgi:hypothetical protein
MLNEATVKLLKQVNISKNTEKTAVRLKEALAAASRADKALIVSQTGQNRNSLYRAVKTGSASARIIIPIAEVLNISPYFLDGSLDEKGECSDAIVKDYLLKLGYKKLFAAPKAVTREKAKAAPKKAAKSKSGDPKVEEIHVKEPAKVKQHADENLQATMFRVTINESEQMREATKNLDLQSATQLLEALFIRAKAGGNAERLCEVVKHCLLS